MAVQIYDKMYSPGTMHFDWITGYWDDDPSLLIILRVFFLSHNKYVWYAYFSDMRHEITLLFYYE